MQTIKKRHKKTLSIHKRIIKELQMTREKERDVRGFARPVDFSSLQCFRVFRYCMQCWRHLGNLKISHLHGNISGRLV
jgi:hypothetical protein